jgi:mRNA-degrading endonuclease RelE of RelBE toxin-antitoxin system
MAYRVELAARAVRDLEILYLQKNVGGSDAAGRSYNGLEEAVFTLANHPQRCPRIPEMKKAGRDLRHLLYGSSSHVYRIIFEIDVRNKVAWVLHIRHGSRKGVRSSDLA